MDWFNLTIETGKFIGGILAIWGVFKFFGGYIKKKLLGQFGEYFSKLDKIHAELTPNGGGSIKDAVNQLRKSVRTIEQIQKAWLTSYPQALFQTDEKGRFTWVNTMFQRMLNCSSEDLLGYGWKNFIAMDYEHIALDLEDAVKDSRDFRGNLCFNPIKGDVVPVIIEARVMRDELGGFVGFLGSVSRREGEC